MKSQNGWPASKDPVDDAFIAPMPKCGHESLILTSNKQWDCSECDAIAKALLP